jgi:hypothetical protein
MKYDDGQALTNYVWTFGKEYISQLEIEFEQRLLDRFYGYGSKNVPSNALPELERVWREYRTLVCTRVLQDHTTFKPQRCAQCNSVLRTPTAKQCFECGNDWHEMIEKSSDQFH